MSDSSVDIARLQQSVENIRENNGNISTQLDKIANNVDAARDRLIRVEIMLESDIHERKKMSHQLKEVENRTKVLEDFKTRFVGLMVGVAFFFSVMWEIVIKYVIPKVF